MKLITYLGSFKLLPWTVGMWLVTLVSAVLALVVAHLQESRSFAVFFKVVASSSFIGLSLAAGMQFSPWGKTALAALALSWLGDVFLAAEGSAWFLAGLGSFLAAHLAFCSVFLQRGIVPHVAFGVLVPLALISIFVVRKLVLRSGRFPRGPVYAYGLALSAMVALAAGTVAHAGNPAIFLAAVSFFVSDLSVARDTFVEKNPLNKVWGLPLYYTAQAIFALSL